MATTERDTKRKALKKIGGCRCVTSGCGCEQLDFLTITFTYRTTSKTHDCLSSVSWINARTCAEIKAAYPVNKLRVRCLRCATALERGVLSGDLIVMVARENERIRQGKQPV